MKHGSLFAAGLAAGVLSLSTAFGATTVEGIGVTADKFTLTKTVLGNFPEGFSINGIADATNALALGYVVYGENVFGGPTKKQVVAGYIANQTGQFHYGYDDGGFPAGRWEQSGQTLIKATGTIVVPSAGYWTLCVGGRDGSWTSLEVSGNGVDSSTERHNGNADEDMLVAIDFPVAGEYPVEIIQYRADGGTWLEFSAAKGSQASFDASAFILVGAPLASYDVVFMDGENVLSTQTVDEGRTATKPADPQKEGCAFLGWLLNGAPYDFTAPVTGDLVLDASWLANQPPVISDVSFSPASPLITGTGVDIALSVTATDADVADTLAYAWSVVGEAPAVCSFDDPSSATPTATVLGPGVFVFKVVVSDGHNAVEDTVTVTVAISADATTFSYAGTEFAGSPIGMQGTVQDPVLADYPWGAAYHDGYKAAWRSTDAGNASVDGRKNHLLDGSRPNAYGLDGYLFPGKCTGGDGVAAMNVTTGEAFDGGMIVSNVTEYIEAIEFTGVEVINDSCIYWIDDPREPISGDVADFKPAAVHVSGMSLDSFKTFARIHIGRKAWCHPVIRIGFLSGYGDGFKPKFASVGSAAHEWEGSGEGYGHLTWAFFDIGNAKAGDIVECGLKGSNPWNVCRIEGIVFDSVFKENGTVILLR